MAGHPWQTVVGGCLDVSEYILYGEYVLAFTTATQRVFESDRSLCHSHWQPEPLDRSTARQFVEGIADDDVAIHLQSTAHTPPEVEQYVHDAVKGMAR